MAELWQQLRPEYSFSIAFSWHAAFNAFSPRTARKNQSGFNIFQSEKKKKKEETLSGHSIALLA